MTAALDPVATHVAELDRVLRGPRAVKRSMLAEMRDGLTDAVADHRERGLDPERAATAAVREFGTVRELAPLLQDELTARQGRHTALLLVVAFPALLLAWDAVWAVGDGWVPPVTPTVTALARAVDLTTVLTAAAALVLLAVTFRGRPLPRWVTGLTGLVAALGILGCGGMSVVMNLLKPVQVGDMAAAGPAATVVVAATAVTAGFVARSAVRSMRLARVSLQLH